MLLRLHVFRMVDIANGETILHWSEVVDPCCAATAYKWHMA